MSRSIGLSCAPDSLKRGTVHQVLSEFPDSIQLLNVGVNSRMTADWSDIEAWRSRGKRIVAHLEEFNVSDELDTTRLGAMKSIVDGLAPEWVEQDLGIWVWGPVSLGAHMLNPLLTDADVARTVSNVRSIQASLTVPVLVENPPVYACRGDTDMLGYMSRVADATACGLVLDVGHLVGYAMRRQLDPVSYLTDWDGWQHVREVHIAGFNAFSCSPGPRWLDNHAMVIPGLGLAVLGCVASFTGPSVPVTLEQEGAPREVIAENLTLVSRVLRAR